MLTYIQINAAKPREKTGSLSDSQGLLLIIQPNGSKLCTPSSGASEKEVAVAFMIDRAQPVAPVPVETINPLEL